MNFKDLGRESFESWLQNAKECLEPKRHVFVCVSGYEERAIFWAKRVLNCFQPSDDKTWCVLGFSDRKDDGSRRSNDAFFKGAGLEIVDYSGDEEVSVAAGLARQIQDVQRRSGNEGIEVHIDYSSMPRRWYCALFKATLELLGGRNRLYMWYSGGVYDGQEFPTAGISDISLFSGRPTITPKVRTHVFGLGFDRVRASAVFRVLDPQNLVCFYGEPGVRHAYVRRVRDDNRDLLASARHEFSVPVDDFPAAFSRIVDVVRDFGRHGDVILVPDGPKPLVLASSLIPDAFERRGVVSLHVRRRRDDRSPGLDVKASGSIYGFSVTGMPQ